MAKAKPQPVASTPYKFTYVTMKRSQLHSHEKNPRSIDQHAFKRLREFMKKNSLLVPLNANRRKVELGFPPDQQNMIVILGGHQRMKAMDELQGYDGTPATDYSVPIALVEVGPAAELEILVGLNNPGLTGTYDASLLADCLSFPGVKPLDTGFDRVELGFLFDSGIVAQICGDKPPEQSTEEASIMASINEITNLARPPGYTVADKAAPPPTTPPAGETPELKDRRVTYPESVKAANDENFILSVVANTDIEMVKFKSLIDIPSEQAFIDLTALLDRLGVKL